MRASTWVVAGGALLSSAVGLALYTGSLDAQMNRPPRVQQYQVDPTFPKPYPTAAHPVNGRPVPWITGDVAGTCVDSNDHLIIVTRGNLTGFSQEEAKGVPAPPVIEFDTEGNVVNAWGDRVVLPHGIHGCFVDYQDNIWIAGNGDGVVQKWKHDGSAMLLQIGQHDVCDNPPTNVCGNAIGPGANQSTTLLNQPADMYVDRDRDPQTGERGSVYIADGYGNHRVVVFSANGTYLRQFGGIAGTVNNPLTDSPGLFASGGGGHPHCVVIGRDDLVYACDRANDRIQVFTKMGELVRIIPVVPGTGATQGPRGSLNIIGSAWDLDFSGGQQRLMYEVDGGNERLHFMDRMTGAILGGFGQVGHEPGKFNYLHSVARDSKGNLYTGETINGRRVLRLERVDCDNGKGNGKGKGAGLERCNDD